MVRKGHFVGFCEGAIQETLPKTLEKRTPMRARFVFQMFGVQLAAFGRSFTLFCDHQDKLQGWIPDYPGTPMIKEGKYTSHVIGNLKDPSCVVVTEVSSKVRPEKFREEDVKYV